MGLDICEECSRYIIDGYCDCEFVPDWDEMLKIAKQDYETGQYPQMAGRSFVEFLRWKGFPPEIIAHVSDEAA